MDTVALGAPTDFSLIALFLRASLTVKIVMALLVLASVWSWATIIQKLMVQVATRRDSGSFDRRFWSGEPLDDIFDRMNGRARGAAERVFTAGMTEWRRRLRNSGKFEGGKLLLFFGARTQQELPYFGPLQSLPKDFIDINLAFSRTPGQPKRYVQDLMRERAADLLALLRDDNSHFYVCGLKGMEEGVVMALRDIAQEAGLSWETLGATLQREGRLHLETY